MVRGLAAFERMLNGEEIKEEASPANALELLQSIYRDPAQPLPTRMKAAVEALPFESPKLSATAVLTSEDFAERLERAISRSGVRMPRNIEAKEIALPQPK